MSKDTTPVVGDVWEIPRRGPRRLVRRKIEDVCEGRVYWKGVMRRNHFGDCSLKTWHAWAANARRVG